MLSEEASVVWPLLVGEESSALVEESSRCSNRSTSMSLPWRHKSSER